MQLLLKLSRLIDSLSSRIGWLTMWLILATTVISAGNAIVRKAFNASSNSLLEIQWYLFAGAVMLGASLVLRVNEHVRVDIVYGQLPTRGKVYIDLFGLVCFLLPVMALMIYLSFPLFLHQFNTGEMSQNAGGLIRWPAMLLLPLGFAMVFLQGLAEIIKRVGWLLHVHEMNLVYERPLQ